MRPLDGLKDYHKECWAKDLVRIIHVMKPQERRPWVMIWYAVFPNSDVVALCEFPQFDYVATKTSIISDVEEYRSIILDAENDIGVANERNVGVPVSARRYDPEYIDALDPKKSVSPISLLARMCRKCSNVKGQVECPHRLIYTKGSTLGGIELVRTASGDKKNGIRPKLYVIKDNCPNYSQAKRNFAYEPNDPGEPPSSEPDSLDKDFNDLDLVLYNAKLNIWPAEPEEVKPSVWAQRNRERNSR